MKITFTNTITLNAARQSAEALWGTGGTEYHATNNPDAHWFSCSSHGGIIADVSCFTKEQLKSLADLGKTSYRGHAGYQILAFEEDCEWCLAFLHGGIKPSFATDKWAEQAKDMFRRIYDRTDPRVKAREAEDEARKRRDPDLITSAYGTWKHGDLVITRVCCADGMQHYVTGYTALLERHYGPDLIPLTLSRCRHAILALHGTLLSEPNAADVAALQKMEG